MKISTRFSDSIHILAFIEIYKGKIPLTSEKIAQSVITSPVVIRRLMGKLRTAGLITTTHGAADPRLNKKADEISLYDVFLAVEGNAHLFSIDKKTKQDCIVGGNIQTTLADCYQQAELAAEGKLANLTIQDVVNSIKVAEARKRAQKS